MKKIIFTLFSAAMTMLPTNAATFGYTNGTFSTSNLFRMGSTTKQGQAIRLSHEKLQMFKGKSISSVNMVFGSRNTTGKTATLFIATSLQGDPVYTQELTISKSVKLLTFDLTTPYYITGEEEELYIGYTAEISTSYKLLSADFATELENCCFAWGDEGWTDTYGTGAGGANIQLNIDDADSFTDVMMAKADMDGYLQSGGKYAFNANVFNFGTETVNDLDVKLTIDGQSSTFRFSDLNLVQGGSTSLTLPEYEATVSGNVEVNIEVTAVNGNADDDVADNVALSHLFFYPENMERALLVEEFTSQSCSNCPSGATTLNSALEQNATLPVVAVMHHSGYAPDIFTMADDYQYTFFYGSNSTYAPAVMINRLCNPLVSQVPVINTVYSYINPTLEYAEQQQPYASIKLESSFDETTREVKVKASFYPHTTLPGKQNLINVVMTQDSIVALQSNGGMNYVHRHAFRGSLTGNAWGLLADFTPGEETTWETTFTLGETIYSDYWTDELLESAGRTKESVDLPVDINQMHIVAYIAEYDTNDVNKNRVYNCTEVKLGESHTQSGYVTSGIDTPMLSDEAFAQVKVNGRRIVVEGHADAVALYDMTGRQIDASQLLSTGVYIVKLSQGNRQVSKKVVVR